jgi:hypothetical protein
MAMKRLEAYPEDLHLAVSDLVAKYTQNLFLYKVLESANNGSSNTDRNRCLFLIYSD